MTTCEIKLQFKDCDDTIALKDAELIKKCPCIERSMSVHNPDWETTNTVVEEPLSIPFAKEAGDFMFTHIRKYQAPAEDDFDTKVEDYPEANEKNLEELKEIIELANYMECANFMNCIGFVIAKKLEKLSVEEIAAYFGVECKPEANFFDEADGWVHPPAHIFEN